MEDRYSAIRAAIGTAGPDDVVLLLGKGHQDWVEHLAEDGSTLRGWLDDRVEARNALLKLKYLQARGGGEAGGGAGGRDVAATHPAAGAYWRLRFLFLGRPTPQD